MKTSRTGLVCLAILAMSACGPDVVGGGDRPPEEFLDAHLSFGDADDTSTCYRVRQLVFFDHAQGAGQPDWKKIDDVSWELTQEVKNPRTGAPGIQRYLFRRKGEHVHIVEYRDPIFDAPVDIILMRTFFTAMGRSGLPQVAGCADPGSASLRKPTE